MDLEARLIDRWDDLYYGTQHALIGIGNLFAHVKRECGITRIIPHFDGRDLYDIETDEPVRRAEFWEEMEVLDFAEEQFSAEDDLDEAFTD